MELHQLRSFVAVAEEAHLTRAARRLHASQAAVSAHVKGLEEEWGLALFDRTPRGMRLTEAGRALRDEAETVLAAVDSLSAGARRLSAEVRGALRVGLNTDPGFLRVIQLGKYLADRFPRLTVSFRQSMSTLIPDSLRSGELDAGFLFCHCDDPGIHVQHLGDVTLVVAGPMDWRERIEQASWGELADMPWIWTPDDCPYHFAGKALFEEHGLPLRRDTITDSEPAIRSLVASGAGLTLLRADDAEELAAMGKVVLRRDMTRPMPFCFACRASRKDEPEMRALMDVVGMVWPQSGQGKGAD